ncbi:hypothetical protein [Rickettsiella endosymbiont of Dermanyssus gallinae]|uniref:hypothetical protein n=1 Tax=Rickettsiella endosymbiont of Dermanyssus gallinae TaxID=2856608 RepID=UPI001C52A3DF|nr:hypothetical protein [Rickettsiella endosymbiont of Dermanyssus gallinae]
MPLNPLQETQSANFLTGVASPQFKTPEVYSSPSAAESFLQGILPMLPGVMQSIDQQAIAKGAVDANANPQDNIEDRAKTQRWWIRDSYKQGYANTALQHQINQYQNSLAELAQQGAYSGYSDTEYYTKRQELHSKLLESVAGYKQYVGKDFENNLAKSLESSNTAGFKAFEKARFGVAQQRSIESAYDSFNRVIINQQGIDAVTPGSSFKQFMHSVNNLQSNGAIPDKDKKEIIKNSLKAYGEAAVSPQQVSDFANYILPKLGAAYASSITALHTSYNKKVREQKPQVLIASTEAAKQISQIADVNQRQAKLTAFSQVLAQHVKEGTLTANQFLKFMKDADPASNPKAALESRIQSGAVTETGIIQQAGQLGLSPQEVREASIKQLNPDSQNISSLIQTAKRDNDPESSLAWKGLLKRGWEYAVEDLGSQIESGKISSRFADMLNFTVSQLRVADSINFQEIADQVPVAYRSAVEAVALTNTTEGNLYQKFKNYLDDKESHANPIPVPGIHDINKDAKQIYDTGAIKGFFTTFGWTGADRDLSDNVIKSQMKAILNELQIQSPDMLRDSPKNINSIVSSIWQQRNPILKLEEIKGTNWVFDTRMLGHFTSQDMRRQMDPISQSRLNSIDPEIWKEGLQDAVIAVLKDKLGENLPADISRKLGDAEFYTDGTSGYHIKFDKANEAGLPFQDVIVSLATINQIAKQKQEAYYTKAKTEGRKAAMPVVYAKSVEDGMQLETVQGQSTNTQLNLDPELRNHILANQLQHSDQPREEIIKKMDFDVLPKVTAMVKASKLPPEAYNKSIELLASVYLSDDPNTAKALIPKLLQIGKKTGLEASDTSGLSHYQRSVLTQLDNIMYISRMGLSLAETGFLSRLGVTDDRRTT